MPSPTQTLLLEAGSSRIVALLCPHNVKRLLKRGQARRESDGELRVEPPGPQSEHPCRTHISSGGKLAALGMSQVYTKSNERGRVHDFKRIFPEDLGCFHQATKPGGW